jgi:broad specificity phosphatase PhoE
MRKKLLLVRHGDTGRPGRYIGKTNVPMSSRGIEQIQALAGLVRTKCPVRIFSSPMRRCTETADILSRHVGMDFSLEPEIREIDFGNWEEMTFEEIRRRYPDESSLWLRLDPGFCFPGGESLGEFQGRIAGFWERLKAMPEDTFLLATHGGVIRGLICLLLGLSLSHYPLFQVRPGSLATVEVFDERGILGGLNEGGPQT